MHATAACAIIRTAEDRLTPSGQAVVSPPFNPLEHVAVADAVPMVLPPALEKLVIDVHLDYGVNNLYTLLFGHESTFMAQHQAAEVGAVCPFDVL